MSEFASEGQREVEEKLKACAERLLDRSVPMSERIDEAEATLRRIRDELYDPKMKPIQS